MRRNFTFLVHICRSIRTSEGLHNLTKPCVRISPLNRYHRPTRVTTYSSTLEVRKRFEMKKRLNSDASIVRASALFRNRIRYWITYISREYLIQIILSKHLCLPCGGILILKILSLIRR